MSLIQLAIILVISFVGMEFVARLLHKYVMHGVLWYLHEDHHNPGGGRFQKNDAFGSIFAVSAIILFYLGFTESPVYSAVAAGMTAYGIAYFVIHDMVIHNRHLPLRESFLGKYLEKLILVHEVHHYSEGKDSVNWGFLFYIPGLDLTPEQYLGQTNQQKGQ